MLVSELVRLSGVLGLIRTNTPFFVHTMTMLRRNTLRHILRRPGAAALPDSPGEALSRFRGDVFEIPLFALWMNDLLGSIAFSTIAVVTMARIDWRVTLLVVLPFIVVGVVANLTSNQVERFRRESRRHAGIVTGFIGELFGAVQAVKVATAEEGVLGYFRSLNRDRMSVALRDRLFNEILNSIFRNAVHVGTGLILIVAGRSMQQGTFTVGDFAAFVFYLDFIGDLTDFSGLLVARYRQIGVSLERMQRLMEGTSPEALIDFDPIYLDDEQPESNDDATDQLEPLDELRAENLSHRFPDSGQGIEGVKLSGGQMQRTAAARMFVRSPQLLVFDDLSSALDVETERVLWERVFRQEGVTCLAVSHRKVALRQADNIVVMKGGRVEAQGRLDDLLESCDEIRRIWFGNEEAVRNVAEVEECASL